MTRRLTVVWPDPELFAGRGGNPVRLLAVSDTIDPALEHEVNRASIGQIDGIVGCGDLEPDYLGFLGDAFHVPVAYVRGNHDRGGQWSHEVRDAPRPLPSGRLAEIGGVTVAPFEWPGVDGERAALRDERRAWWDVLRATGHLLVRRLRRARGPVLVVSHAPPRGVGDSEADPYHLGYNAYRWLLDRLRPPLWLHGHVTPASVRDWRDASGPTTVANVTGAVLVELVPPAG